VLNGVTQNGSQKKINWKTDDVSIYLILK
jgi:hypothetical protein